MKSNFHFAVPGYIKYLEILLYIPSYYLYYFQIDGKKIFHSWKGSVLNWVAIGLICQALQHGFNEEENTVYNIITILCNLKDRKFNSSHDSGN